MTARRSDGALALQKMRLQSADWGALSKQMYRTVVSLGGPDDVAAVVEWGARPVNESMHARALIRELTEPERDALAGLLRGESVQDLAHRQLISKIEAADCRESMRWKLGVLRDAEAVRIGLMAGIEDLGSA